MRQANKVSFGRVLLALAAVLVVAFPGLLLADQPTGAYAYPTKVSVNGPIILNSGQTANYSTQVTFANPSQTVAGDPEATYTVTGADSSTESATGVSVTAPTVSSPTKITITATYSYNGQNLTGVRNVIVRPSSGT